MRITLKYIKLFTIIGLFALYYFKLKIITFNMTKKTDLIFLFLKLKLRKRKTHIYLWTTFRRLFGLPCHGQRTKTNARTVRKWKKRIKKKYVAKKVQK